MKEKIYDFGELGKWSEATIKEQMVSHQYRRIIRIIEEDFKQQEEYINNSTNDYANKKTRKLSLLDIHRYIKELNKLDDQLKSLYKDYRKYLATIAKIKTGEEK